MFSQQPWASPMTSSTLVAKASSSEYFEVRLNDSFEVWIGQDSKQSSASPKRPKRQVLLRPGHEAEAGSRLFGTSMGWSMMNWDGLEDVGGDLRRFRFLGWVETWHQVLQPPMEEADRSFLLPPVPGGSRPKNRGFNSPDDSCWMIQTTNLHRL